MKIETKYDIGQKVWLMFRGNICHLPIIGLNVSADYRRYAVYYVVVREHLHLEEELFPSKEELLKSL